MGAIGTGLGADTGVGAFGGGAAAGCPGGGVGAGPGGAAVAGCWDCGMLGSAGAGVTPALGVTPGLGAVTEVGVTAVAWGSASLFAVTPELPWSELQPIPQQKNRGRINEDLDRNFMESLGAAERAKRRASRRAYLDRGRMQRRPPSAADASRLALATLDYYVLRPHAGSLRAPNTAIKPYLERADSSHLCPSRALLVTVRIAAVLVTFTRLLLRKSPTRWDANATWAKPHSTRATSGSKPARPGRWARGRALRKQPRFNRAWESTSREGATRSLHGVALAEIVAVVPQSEFAAGDAREN